MTDPRDDPTPDEDEGSDVLPSEDDAATDHEPTTVTVSGGTLTSDVKVTIGETST